MTMQNRNSFVSASVPFVQQPNYMKNTVFMVIEWSFLIIGVDITRIICFFYLRVNSWLQKNLAQRRNACICHCIFIQQVEIEPRRGIFSDYTQKTKKRKVIIIVFE